VKVLIIGCGRVGSRLAIELGQARHEVTIIDTKPSAFNRLGDAYTINAMVGNGIDEDMLRRAGIEDADVFIAVTNGDNRNIMAAQIAQHVFNVPKVVCRIYDPIRHEVYSDLGLNTYCPTIEGTNKIQSMLRQ
jgi:trk system potassium uptake protein TrkA